MKKIIADLVADIQKYSPSKVILFGSQARGDADKFSDFDILIIKETKKRFIERLREAASFLRSSLPSVNVFVYNQKEIEKMKQSKNPFIGKVLKEGKLLYEAKNN